MPDTRPDPAILAVLGALVGSLPGAVASTAILVAMKLSDSLSALGYVPLGMLAIAAVFAGATIGCWRTLRRRRVARAGATAVSFCVIALALTAACGYLGAVSGQTIFSPVTALEYLAVLGLSAAGAARIVQAFGRRPAE